MEWDLIWRIIRIVGKNVCLIRPRRTRVYNNVEKHLYTINSLVLSDYSGLFAANRRMFSGFPNSIYLTWKSTKTINQRDPTAIFFYTGSGDGGGGGRELDGQTGRPVATGADSRAVPSDITGMAGQTEHVSGGVRVDWPGKVVLAPVDQARPVRPDGNGELQLAAGHVVPSVVRQGAQPVAVALLASVFLRAAPKHP